MQRKQISPPPGAVPPGASGAGEAADLGMRRDITRRDFLGGFPLAITGAAALAPLPGALFGAEQRPAAPYPPALTGLRGSHPGSFEVAHRLARRVRAEGAWDDSGAADSGAFDLVVVGGGISGLAAAYHYRKVVGPDATILVLDNHDDFGGHAKRNEFTHAGRTIIGYGGTQSLDSPATFSAAAKSLLRDLGVDTEIFYTAFDRDYYRSRGLGSAVFFGSEDFGADRLVAGVGAHPTSSSASEIAAAAPLSARGRADFVRLHDDPGDPWPGLGDAAKKDRLATLSYRGFLEALGMGAEVQALYRQRPHSLFGMGSDGVPALDLWSLGYPGFDGLRLAPGSHPRLSRTARPNPDPEPYIFHFPDGNATIARLLVRKLIPAAAPGSTPADLVRARLDYRALDRPGAKCRIRLSATAVRVRAEEGAVTYVRAGSEVRVRAGRVVLAGYNQVVPFLVPEMPAEQRRALSYPPKVPLVYTNALLRDWTAFAAAGARAIHFPAGFHASLSLDFPVSLGGYRFSRGPEDLIVLHCVRTPCRPGRSAREQHRAGREELLRTPFSTFEEETRRQLARALGPYGFDPARDLLGLTVNRWPHGYSFEYNSLWDPPFPPGAAPHEIGRRPFGRVHLAGADSGAYAYTQSALDQAHRAVGEILDETGVRRA